ncbi:MULTISPECIES: phage terminase large subunit [unclassified Neisseria]|uniref:phage terminase large subunit n=1 Tax=unclassified Neisseria TaxID=2623750 RepID=UPI00266547ED|nr:MULTISPECIES: phage terminase large subunit [unclassified Neisseria]MDO1509952.1 phage terminase large subunit [Neisseria sp. MVDL19-042950]MDO1516151.1 phage terminase large subunit [Neisseria sp. MVDL18-041461]MDO1563266.1 phage terminase large subunit [Neisseria sp. MVDL20-010259]
MSKKKLTRAQLRERMESIRLDLIQRIEAEDAGLSDAVEDIAARREKVFNPETGFRFFLETYFPHHIRGDSWSEFHDYLIDDVVPRITQSPEAEAEADAAPRGEAKTTLGVQIKSLWDEVRNAKHNVVIISDVEDQAAGSVEVIKTELTENKRLALDFPEVCGVGRRWRVGEIITRQGNKIKAYGSGMKLRGTKHGARRPDMAYLDDIENDENVETPRQRAKLMEWVNKAVLPLGAAGEKFDVLYVGTILHYDSVLNRVLANPFWTSRRFQAIIKWPENMDLWDEWETIYKHEGRKAAKEFYEANEAEMLAGSKVSWEQRPLLLLMTIRARIGKEAFDCEYQNEPVSGEDAIFANMIEAAQFADKDLPSDLIWFGALDPSLGKRNANRDPSAILIGGWHRATVTLYVVVAQIRRRVPDKIIEDVIRLQKQYKCRLWAVEIVQFQEFLKTELTKRGLQQGIPIPARGVKPIADKELRIESIQPHMENGYIRIHKDNTELIDQLRRFPKHAHDDGPDALQMLWALAVGNSAPIEWQSVRPSETHDDFDDDLDEDNTKSMWAR